MRIAFVVNWFPVVSETFILNQACGLLDRGCEVHIFPLNPPQATWEVLLHPDVEERDLLRKVHYLPGLNGARLLGWLRHRPRTRRRLLNLATRVAYTRSSTAGTSFSWRRALLSAVRLSNLCGRLLVARRYDVIHCQFGTTSFDVSSLKRLSVLRTPVVCSFRGNDISGVLQREGPDVYNHVFPQLARALPNCRVFAQRLVQLGCDPNKIEILPSGLKIDRYHFRGPSLPQPGKPIELCTIGRLAKRKGVDDAIRALEILRRSFPAARLTVLGDGPERSNLERLTRELGLQESVNFLGNGSWRDVIQLLEGSHLFVAAFRTPPGGDQDGPSNVLKEAMAIGLPVVSTRHGGVPELVEHEATGLLADEGDPGGLAALLTRLLEHPQDWHGLTRRARARVEDQYDAERALDLQLDIYRRIIEETRS